jgi:hypothetical protein
MTKEIIPHKLITVLDEVGNVKESVIQYRLKIDGILQSKFNTISISSNQELDSVIQGALIKVQQAEGLT